MELYDRRSENGLSLCKKSIGHYSVSEKLNASTNIKFKIKTNKRFITPLRLLNINICH